MSGTASERAAEVFRHNGGVLRISRASALGISRSTIYRMVDAGQLDRVARGLYRLTDTTLPGDPYLVIVTRMIPDGVICLVSALSFHSLTTQIPHEIQIAISRTSRYPELKHPPIRFFRYGEETLRAGVESHSMDGDEIRVFSAEKTIADCFKYRNKIGPDIAVEALRLYWQRRQPDISALMRYARICRVGQVIRPYVEVLQ